MFLNLTKNIKYSAENGASRKIVGIHPRHKAFQPSDVKISDRPPARVA